MALARLFITGLVVAGLANPTSASGQSQAPRSSMPADHGEGPMTNQTERIHDSLKVLTELNATPDNAIPKHLLEGAEAIVVIPSLVKGGFIIGAKHGKGVVACAIGPELVVGAGVRGMTGGASAGRLASSRLTSCCSS